MQSIEAATPVGFTLVDRDLRIVRFNQTLADIEGRPVEECIGWTVAELVPDLWPQLENLYRRVLAGETINNVDVSKPSAADPHRMRHWLTSYYPVRIDGEIIGVGKSRGRHYRRKPKSSAPWSWTTWRRAPTPWTPMGS